MGEVYEAHDPVIERRVAIKLVSTNLLVGEDREAYLDRFRQEARAAGRCSHPAIVAVFDFAVHQGNPYLAMEYVDGVGLDQALAQGKRFTPHTAAHIVLQLLDALASAHALGIVHRDIKPANILLLAGGRIKVTDFGIARLDNSGLTLYGMAIGTPRYMSPEQWLGEEVDGRSDLYSTAVLMQELLTGERPSPKRSTRHIGSTSTDTLPAGSEKITAAMGTALRAVLGRALKDRPEERFDSAATMADALRAAMEKTEAPAFEPADEIDKTVISARARPVTPAAPGRLSLDPSLVTGIERQLARHLGPIAGYLVRSTLKSADSIEGLCDTLSQRIERPDERNKFLTAVLGSAPRTSNALDKSADSARNAASASRGGGAERTTVVSVDTSGTDWPLTEQEVERSRHALAEFIGPIAKVLVSRSLPKASTSRELWDLLAVNIESPAERAAFLARRVKSRP